MSQLKKDHGKLLPCISNPSALSQYTCDSQSNIGGLDTLEQENDQQKMMYNVLYMAGPLVGKKQFISDKNNCGVRSLEGSMNPNANFFVPRAVYEQNAQQVHYRLAYHNSTHVSLGILHCNESFYLFH